jgi:hypothetical protein
MKFKIIFTALICYLVFFTVSCSTLIRRDFSQFESDSERISLQYPKNWERNNNNNSYAIFVAISPPENEQDTFRENVNIVTEVALGYSLESYYRGNLATMHKLLDSFTIIREGERNINSNPSKWVIYNYKYNEVDITVKAYFFHTGLKGIVFTATANPSSFKKYEATFDDIVSTLRIK